MKEDPMSDFDRWTQSVRASRQLYRLTVAPELWRCHELMVHADRVTRGLPTRWGDVSWRRGGVAAKVAGLGARMTAAWGELTHRAAHTAPVR
jgi:hypothetical protein